MEDRAEVGNLIYSVTLEEVFFMAEAGWSKDCGEGIRQRDVANAFIPYYAQAPEELIRSLKEILHAFGLPRRLLDVTD